MKITAEVIITARLADGTVQHVAMEHAVQREDGLKVYSAAAGEAVELAAQAAVRAFVAGMHTEGLLPGHPHDARTD